MSEDQTNEEKTQEHGEPEVVQYVDKLIYLDSGDLIIGRIIMHKDSEKYVYVFRPVIIIEDENGSHLRPWMPESSDEFFSIPTTKVQTVSTPRQIFMKTYQDTYIKSVPPNPVDMTDTDDTRVLH